MTDIQLSRLKRIPVGPTPVLAHALFPQIPKGLIPVVVKELENRIEMMVFHCLDILSQLFESALRLRFAVRRVKESHKLPKNTAEAVHKPFALSFQFCHGLLFLHRYIGGLLQEDPTQLP